MLADGITWLSVFHQRDEAEVQKALNISVYYSVIRSLGLSITEVQSFLHAEPHHGFEELLHGFGILVEALIFEVGEKAVNFLFLPLLVVSLFQMNCGPLIKVVTENLAGPHSS
jgi:intergrase/recombinase